MVAQNRDERRLVEVDSGRPGTDPGRVGQVQTTEQIWTPDARLLAKLPVGFELPLRVIEYENERRVLPAIPHSQFLARAALLGEVIQAHLGLTDQARLSNSRVMRLLFPVSGRLQERLDRGSLTWKDLTRTGSLDPAEHLLANWLPSREPLAEWLSRAAEPCREMELPETWVNRLICLVDLLAESNAAPPADTGKLNLASLRQQLFAPGPLYGTVTDADKQRVYGRLADRLRRHLNDDDHQFQTWLLDNFSGIVHQISKQKRDGDPMERPLVRQTLIELLFDSWSYVGRNVWVAMKIVRDSLIPALTATELSAFNALYQRNRYYGDIPLILLQAELPKIRPAVAAILNAPDRDENWLRLHWSLQIWRDLQLDRRTLDRERKSPQRVSLGDHVTYVVDAVAGSRETVGTTSHERSQRILQRCAQAWLQISPPECPSGCAPAWSLMGFDVEQNDLTAKITCSTCGAFLSTLVKLRDLQRCAGHIDPEEDDVSCLN